MPKLLEKILPKKMLSAGKKKSEASDTKTEQSSGIGTGDSEKESVCSRNSSQTAKISSNKEGKSANDLSGPSEDTEVSGNACTSFASKPSSKKNCNDVSQSSVQKSTLSKEFEEPVRTPVVDTNSRGLRTQPSDNTQDLLNRVLKAIEKLGTEQPKLSNDVPHKDKRQGDSIAGAEEYPESIGRLKVSL